MPIILDLIILLFILLSTYLGYKKGLIGVAFKILSFIIAIIITLILFKPVSNYIIHNTEIDDNIKASIVEKLSGAKIEENGIIKESVELPKIVVDSINDSINDTIVQTKDSIINEVADNLTTSSINIIVMISLFIIIKILLIFAKVIFEAIAELPIIKQFNESGGIIYGILRAIIILYVIFALISFILPMMNNNTIIAMINNSIIGKFMYNNNLILKLFF